MGDKSRRILSEIQTILQDDSDPTLLAVYVRRLVRASREDFVSALLEHARLDEPYRLVHKLIDYGGPLPHEMLKAMCSAKFRRADEEWYRDGCDEAHIALLERAVASLTAHLRRLKKIGP